MEYKNQNKRGLYGTAGSTGQDTAMSVMTARAAYFLWKSGIRKQSGKYL